MNRNYFRLKDDFFQQGFPKILVAVAMLWQLVACEAPIFEPNVTVQPETPREVYWAALDSTGLANTPMARTWEDAGRRALNDSVFVEPPFREIAYFRASEPQAFGYRLALKMGEVLQVALKGTPDTIQYFVDIFQVIPTDSTTQIQRIVSAEAYQSDSLGYEAEQAGIYLVRVQTELLVSGRFEIQLLKQPAYGSFPVQGKANPDIWSVFGDPRDGGRRTHKGIDIFAPRGTPVLAATRGVTRRVRDKGLGGKQVWLYDPVRNQSLYYAHLDSQLVVENQLVEAGDTLGTVGNTGNARSTRPHLHLGLYRRGQGAIDPRPYVAYQSTRMPYISSDTARLGQLARVRYQETRLRAAPHPRAKQIGTLDQHLPLEIRAASKNWYRVLLPDGFSGYLPASQVEATTGRIAQRTIMEATDLLQAPQTKASPVATLAPKVSVDIIARTDDYQLVRDERGAIGWLMAGDQ